MLSYEFYKVLHFVSIFFFIAGMSATFLMKPAPKFIKIVTGIASFLILVGGMGLLARIGFSHGQGAWPAWVQAKVGIWLVLAIGAPVLGKRIQNDSHRPLVWLFGILLACIAAYSATFKYGA